MPREGMMPWPCLPLHQTTREELSAGPQAVHVCQDVLSLRAPTGYHRATPPLPTGRASTAHSSFVSLMRPLSEWSSSYSHLLPAFPG